MEEVESPGLCGRKCEPRAFPAVTMAAQQQEAEQLAALCEAVMFARVRALAWGVLRRAPVLGGLGSGTPAASI